MSTIKCQPSKGVFVWNHWFGTECNTAVCNFTLRLYSNSISNHTDKCMNKLTWYLFPLPSKGVVYSRAGFRKLFSWYHPFRTLIPIMQMRDGCSRNLSRGLWQRLMEKCSNNTFYSVVCALKTGHKSTIMSRSHQKCHEWFLISLYRYHSAYGETSLNQRRYNCNVCG